MSLINQALKKEQQRRSLNLQSPKQEIPSYESQPLSANQVVRRDQARSPLPLLVGFASLGLFLLVCGGAAVYFGKSYLSSLAPEQAAAAKAPAAPETAPTPVANALQNKEANAQAVDAVVAEVEAPSPSEAPDSPQETVSNESSPANPPATVETPPEEPKFNLAAQAHVDELQVHGFRSAGPNSRLLMSGRVYKIGDIVSHEFALRFRGAENGTLIFVDANGLRYEKPL
jgi:hypothetical protein